MTRPFKYPIKNICFIFILSIISVIYFPLCQLYLPDKFNFDSGIVKLGMLDPLIVSKSFRNTSDFFKFIGFNYYTPSIFINIFSWIIFILILITILRINKNINFSLSKLILIFIFEIMYGAYFFNYSKDIIIFLFCIIALNLPPIHNDILINIILAIGIYGYFFRSYWLIICIISLIPLCIKKVKLNRDLFYIFCSIILIIIAFNLLKHSQVTNLRVMVNEPRIGNNYAQSIIHNLVTNTSIYTDIINYIYVFISMFIPIQGFPSISVIIYYLWIICLVLFCIMHRKNIDIRLVLILLIYVSIQAMFEPDFGSVFRHQLAWTLIIYCMFDKKLVED